MPDIKEFKQIVIDECKRIIGNYIDLVKSKNDDEMFLKGLDNPDKNEEECINYIMNNLVDQRIYGGDDKIMYPYIHDYYVDTFEDDSKLKDKWSNMITGGRTTTVAAKPTEKEILEAYDALGNEKKNEIYQEQLKKAQEEAYKKAQAKIKEDEKKAKEKAKQKAEEEKKAKKEKADAEKKAKEEALQNGAGSQMSLFDL